MNQWDKKPTMTVVYGEGLPHHILQQVAYRYTALIKSDMDTKHREDMLVYDILSMNGQEHIDMAIAGIQDQLGNVPLIECTEHLEDIEVSDPDGDDLYVSIYKGKYFGQNCKATVYVVTI